LIPPGASSLGERLLMFECLTPIRDDYSLFMARQISMVWLIPLASVFLCILFWFVLFRRKWSFDGFISSLMILFYTFFPSIVTRVALTSSCQKYGSRTLLSEALSVECWQEKHWTTILTVGLPGLLLYVIIIPLALGSKMITQRRALTLYHDQEKYDPKWTLRYGFVFAGYRSGYEWWESIIMLRKCCFVLLSIFLGVYGATPQVVAASMVLVLALSLQLQYLPFQNEDHNLLESIGLHACLLQLLVALLCNSVGKTNNTLNPVSTIILILVMFGSSVGFFWWTLRVTVQNSQDTEGAVGVFAHVFAFCCKRKEVPVSNVVTIRTKSDAYTIAALRMQVLLQEALKKTARKQTIVPLKQSGLRGRSRSRGVMGRDGTIKGSLRYQAKVAVVMKRAKDNLDEHAVSSIARKKQREVNRTHAKSRLTDRLQSRSKKNLDRNNIVVPMMVPTSNEAIVTPKEETVALHVIKMDTVKNVVEDVDTLLHVAQVRSLMADAIKTSVHLRKMYTKFNKGDASMNTISKKEFEMLVAHIIKQNKKKKKDNIEIHFFEKETWIFIVGKDQEIITFDQLAEWLFGQTK
jgi:hypothetical protein